MRFTLRQLEVFLAVARLGNLTRAAGELNMSQSAASSALKDLETHCDTVLFDRIGKRLHLNERGMELQPKVESLMAMAGELEMDFLQETGTTELKVGATMSIGSFMAMQMVSQYIQTYPDAPISLDIDNTEHIAEKVLNYQLDMGLIEGEYHHAQLKIEHWCDDELSLFCSPEHALAKQGNLNDDDLINADWVIRETGSGTRQTFDRAMVGLLPKLTIILELTETEAIKRAVQQNIGIGCLSLMTLEAELERGDLVRLNLSERDLHRKLYLISHKQKHIGPSLQRWLNLCEQWSV